MFNRKAELAAGLLLAGAALAGCAHKPSIVGTWSGTHMAGRGVAVKQTWTFNANGSSSFSMQAANGPLAGVPLRSVGTYTVNDTTLTNSISSMSEGARTKTVASPRPEAFHYTLNGDTLTMTEPGMSSPLVLTRVTP